MKTLKHLTLIACAAMLTLALPSCNLFGGDDDPVGMNAADVKPALLIGKWKNDGNANNFKRYTTTSSKLPDASYEDGSDWTLGETTEGQEGTEFYYKVVGNRLTEQYPNMSTYLPRQYTLITLTANKLEYFDSYNETTSWTKQ
jgi:hypothetical protein